MSNRFSILLPISLALLAASSQPRPPERLIWLEDAEPDPVITAPLDLPRVAVAARSGDRVWFHREVARVTLIDPGGLESIRFRNELYAMERQP